MLLRLLLITPSPSFNQLMNQVLDEALELTGLDAVLHDVSSLDKAAARLNLKSDDVILLDWDSAGSKTPALVRQILTADPRLRLVVMLPFTNRQYRREVWEAGACHGIPKTHVDQEWMATVLCIMQRAMERENRVLQGSIPTGY